MAKKLNHSLAKMHRSYTVSDVCELFELHKNTVLNWIKNGLETIDDQKPAMIQGITLKNYLKNRNTESKVKCKRDEMFCMKCRMPKAPNNKKVYFYPQKGATGQLKGVCPQCKNSIFKFCSERNLESFDDCFEIIFVSDQ